MATPCPKSLHGKGEKWIARNILQGLDSRQPMTDDDDDLVGRVEFVPVECNHVNEPLGSFRERELVCTESV